MLYNIVQSGIAIFLLYSLKHAVDMNISKQINKSYGKSVILENLNSVKFSIHALMKKKLTADKMRQFCIRSMVITEKLKYTSKSYLKIMLLRLHHRSTYIPVGKFQYSISSPSNLICIDS